jgi:large repetitive protein
MTVTDPYAGLVINEVDYDQVGTDTAEFIEVYNSGSQAIDLSTLALVLVNGSNNLEYARLNLVNAGSSIAPGQYLVVKSSATIVLPPGTLTMQFAGTTDQIQNGAPDGVALVDTASLRLLDTLSYEGSITAAVITGFPGTYNLVEGTPLSASVADNNSVNGSLGRLPNGIDSNDTATDRNFTTTPTPGAPNAP